MYPRIIRTLKSPFLTLFVFSLFSGLLKPAAAQSVSSNSSLNFGLIEYAASHSGDLTLATDGGVSLNGSGLFYQGNAVPGQVTIGGNSGIAEIRCSQTAALGGSSSLPITDINANVAASGFLTGAQGVACEGTGGADAPVFAIDLDFSPNPRLYLGGTLHISSGAFNGGGVHSSSASGGMPLTVSVVFQ